MTRILTAESLPQAVGLARTFSRNGQILTVADEMFGHQLEASLPRQDIFVVEGGEQCKTQTTVGQVWQWLMSRNATRSTLLLVVGGGSVTDMAGFAAACFKRGIDTVYVPTTLLAAADAAIGGKTGINYGGLKNEIGAFHQPAAVVMTPTVWRTLPGSELASGYGEILKTAFLRSEHDVMEALRTGERLAQCSLCAEMPVTVETVAACACFKQGIVEKDPYESGPRKQLNLGHTFAHSLESYARRRNLALTHGHAVAVGLVAMAALSNMTLGLPGKWMEMTASVVRKLYAPFIWKCDDFDELYGYMCHDKKNSKPGSVCFTLIHAPGQPVVDCVVPAADIRAALEIAADCLA